MRARLLDLGEVSALRSQSIPHAVAAGMADDHHPALLLAQPSGAYVLVGAEAAGESASAGSVKVESCRERGVAVLAARLGGAPRLVDGNQLLVTLALPLARAGELGLDGPPERRNARFAAALAAAWATLGIEVEFFPFDELLAGGRRIGWLGGAELEGGLCLAAALPFDVDARLHAELLGIDARTLTSVRGELETVDAGPAAAASLPDLAAMAEAVAAAAEEVLDLELIPSMPTPGELEAIYDWDRRLGRHVGDLQATAAALPA